VNGLFLNKKKFDKLILFFNGWSLDENIVNHLTSDKYDVLMFYDYSDLEISQEILNKINSYDEISVVAWSFGVWACGNVINYFDNIKNAIAINGTLIPIDNNLGISEKIFNLTLTHLSEENYVRFFKNMFAGTVDLSKISTRSIENKRQELEQIKNLSASKSCAQNTKFFNKVFISTNDKIIPAKNQLNFWGKSNAQIIKIDGGHYIFDIFKTWDEIING
jgi:pimeloyl-[acyl-carrier protein] methyl ester esterase